MTVRWLRATFWMARTTMAAARASSPLVGSLQVREGRKGGGGGGVRGGGVAGARAGGLARVTRQQGVEHPPS